MAKVYNSVFEGYCSSMGYKGHYYETFGPCITRVRAVSSLRVRRVSDSGLYFSFLWMICGFICWFH